MGKLEKVVVLTVLFLVALILGVSLNAPEGVAKPDPTATAADEGDSPAGGREVLAAEPATQRKAPITRRETPARGTDSTQKAGAQPPTRAASHPAPRPLAPDAVLAQSEPAPPTGPAGIGGGPAGTLSTARPGAVGAATPPPSDTPTAGDGALQTEHGLAPSLSDEFMIYTWQEGDTFAGVAERYFGSRLHVSRLLRNNEGLEDREMRAGDQILIPVRAEEGPGTPAAVGATTYTVQSGDVLGTISMNVYGTSKSWRKIYDANRDVLADPNRLEVGQVLRIPE